MVSEGS